MSTLNQLERQRRVARQRNDAAKQHIVMAEPFGLSRTLLAAAEGVPLTSTQCQDLRELAAWIRTRVYSVEALT